MTRKFKVTVNGNTYEVDVEEIGEQSFSNGGVTSTIVEPPRQNTSAPIQEKVQTKSVAGGQGSIKIEAPMQGKIIDVKVTVGQTVKDGDVIAVLEAMKMENEIIAMSDGVVATIDVTSGQSVESGDIIASLN